MATPLTDLKKGTRRSIALTTKARCVFQHLNAAFTSTHSQIAGSQEAISCESGCVGGWNRGGVVTAPQQHRETLPVHIFSRKISPAEHNYDIGNSELLAVKAVLEEWRQWLEGLKRPFTLLTDHHNLEYIRQAKN